MHRWEESYLISTGYGEQVAPFISCRLNDIDGFFTRNKADYLALVFEREDSYLGREVSCPSVPDSQKRPRERAWFRPVQATNPCTFISQALPDPWWDTGEV